MKYKKECGRCFWFNGECGDGVQFCDLKETDVSEYNLCSSFKPKDICIECTICKNFFEMEGNCTGKKEQCDDYDFEDNMEYYV